MKGLRTIAIEEHFSTPLLQQNQSPSEFRKFYLQTRSARIGHDIREQGADMGAKRLAHMDASGIDVQVLSFGAPGPQPYTADVAVPMARDANDRAAALVREHPTRFAAFAALATADPKESVRELERTVRDLGFKGAMIHGHSRGEFLDDKKFWGIFECAAALDVPIYLHPTNPHPGATKTYFDGYEELAGAGWGYAIDTTCHFLRIMFAGVFDAFPKLRIILGHLGEGIPFGIHRLDDYTREACGRRGLRKTPLEYVRDHLSVTTSGNWFEPAFACTVAALGIDNVLFAVDWPYEPNTAGIEFLKRLSLSDHDKAKVAHGNAERILKLSPGP